MSTNRTVMISLRLSPVEKQMLKKVSQALGIKPSEALRELIRKCYASVRKPPRPPRRAYLRTNKPLTLGRTNE